MVVNKLKVGLVARADNSGLGNLSWDLYKNLDFEKVMIVTTEYEVDYDRYDEDKRMICDRGIPTLNEMKKFVEGLDLLIAIETPYNWNLFKVAKDAGVKTALIVMYEWTPTEKYIPIEPDVYLCPTQVDFDAMWGDKRVLLPIPVNRDEAEFIQRPIAKDEEPLTFIFNNGHGGYGGRNSLTEFLQAISIVREDVKFIIRSQVDLEEGLNDSRVEIQLGELKFEDLWNAGDVYIHAHKFDGLSLPIQEALSAGMPIIALDREPYNSILPEKLLFSGSTTFKMDMPKSVAGRKIESTVVDPVKLASRITEVAKMDRKEIARLSVKSGELAEQFSWETLKVVYEKTFEQICNS